jgi:hypothetical protein
MESESSQKNLLSSNTNKTDSNMEKSSKIPVTNISTTLSQKLSLIEKDSYEPIEYDDMKNEEAIFEVFKCKEYTDIVSNIIQSIDSYYADSDTYDDYPYFRVQNTCKFIPNLNTKSDILSERQLRELHSHLPYYNQYKNLKLAYSLSIDGCYLKTFYTKLEGIKNSILIIKDDNQNVFGVYASEEYKNNSHGFYGTGETFLFTFYKTERIHCFPSTGFNDYYIYSDDKILSFGCSDNYFSLSLEKDFLCGYTKSTQTFKNPPLSLKENFFVSKMELWTFWDNAN